MLQFCSCSTRRAHRDLRGLRLGKAIDACTDAGEGDRAQSMLISKKQAVPVTIRELLRLVFRPTVPYRPHGMYHMSRQQSTGTCDHCFTHFAAALTGYDRSTILQDLPTSSTMDRTVHTSATQKASIGRVHDHVDLDLGDITLYDPDIHAPKIATPSSADMRKRSKLPHIGTIIFPVMEQSGCRMRCHQHQPTPIIHR